MTSPHPRPDVTVVVIVYNDAARIATAVRSVLDQSLRSREVIVVDDHSTDHTPAVVERLVAQNPGMVRYIRLPTNSGGCGAPRNAGVSQARGRYVMFLDSDDTLDKHACRNMVAMAEESGADLVIGRCVRHDVATGKEHSWMPWLVQSKVVYESLRDQPELLYDVLSTNKLYRHDFLVRENLVFVENRLYEDNLFSAHAYLTAKKIAIIPQRIYTWNIERKEGGAQSITNRARDLRNITDRIAITQEIDKLLARHGGEELRLQKDIRFIENDLRTHLSGLGQQPEAAQRALMDACRPYVQTLQPEAFRQAKPLQAIAAYMVRQDDVDGVASAHDYMVNRGHRAHLTTQLVVRDGRVYWCDRHLDDPLGRDVLDVTELGFQDLPLDRAAARQPDRGVPPGRHHGHPARRDHQPDRPAGRARQAQGAAGRPGPAQQAAAVHGARRAEHRAHRGDLDHHLRRGPGAAPDRRGGHGLLADAAGAHRRRDRRRPPVRRRRPDRRAAAAGAAQAHPARGRPDGGLPHRRRQHRDAAVRRGPAGQGRRRHGQPAALPAARRPGLGQGRQPAPTICATGSTTARPSWPGTTRCSRGLPISNKTIVFESHMGKQFSDSPRAIYEELKRSGAAYRPVWVLRRRPPERLPERRQAGPPPVVRVPARARPGPVLGGQPGLPARPAQAARHHVHPDLARLGVQADGLRRGHHQERHQGAAAAVPAGDRPLRRVPGALRARRAHPHQGAAASAPS